MTLQQAAHSSGVALEWVAAAASAGLLALGGIDADGEPLVDVVDLRWWIGRGCPIDDLDEVC